METRLTEERLKSIDFVEGDTLSAEGAAWIASMRAELRERREAEKRTPNLLTYMTTPSGPVRDAAFLRTYAERVRNGTELLWDIPTTRANTLADIAARLEASAPPPREERTCATCRYWSFDPQSPVGRGFCLEPAKIAVKPPATFYCTLHDPLTPSPPSASPGETQE